MAPIKFEENIKEKLDKRTIQPSTDAWNKLSTRLNENKKRNNKPFRWLGIAASIIGVFFVASQFFNNHKKVEHNHKIVVTPEFIKQAKTTKITTAKTKKGDKILEQVKLKENKKPNHIIKNQTIIKPNITNKNIVIAQENNIPKLEQESLKPKKNILTSVTIEDQKIQDVVAQIKNLKENKIEVTDQTINTLLAQAQKEIALEKLYNNSTGIVDANLLLQDVEADLEESFRAKVFKALKENFNSVKTAVAQRND